MRVRRVCDVDRYVSMRFLYVFNTKLILRITGSLMLQTKFSLCIFYTFTTYIRQVFLCYDVYESERCCR